MYQFIETICYENGCFQRIRLHNERCNRTRNHFFGCLPPLDLGLFLSVPIHLVSEKVKCTVTYGADIENIEYALYKIKPIGSLQMVYDDTIDYDFKFADRLKLSELVQKKGQCDDILIIKNGLISDTSYANALFLRGGRWYSQQNPLLKGTRLESYLQTKMITPFLIRPKDLSLFSEIRIINAMISIEDSPVIPVTRIFP